MKSAKQEIKELLHQACHGEKPVVYVNACTHGNETVGARVLKELKKLKLEKGTLITNIANRRAFDLGKRFVDTDLNRSFPGKPKGAYEERLAYVLSPLVRAVDVVIDIHSTGAGEHSSVIVTKLDEPTAEIVRLINPKRVLVMAATRGNALISSARVGIALEHGKDRNKSTYDRTLRDILRVLSGLGMIRRGLSRRTKPWPEFYLVSEPLKKQPGFIIVKGIRNFVLVKKGQVVARDGQGKEVKAPKDFYPVLFGENTYTKIFGFMGKRMERGDLTKF